MPKRQHPTQPDRDALMRRMAAIHLEKTALAHSDLSGDERREKSKELDTQLAALNRAVFGGDVG